MHPLTELIVCAQLSDVWYHSVDLLRGFRDGSILTIDSNDKAKPSFDGRRRYIYNKASVYVVTQKLILHERAYMLRLQCLSSVVVPRILKSPAAQLLLLQRPSDL